MARIDLEPKAVREAAGPADFPRLKQAAHRGSKLHASSLRGGFGGSGGVWSPGAGLRKRLVEYEEIFAAERQEIDRIVELVVSLDSEQAEIVATLYACWNDVLASGASPDDETIIREFHGWSPGKRRFDASRLVEALEWMRRHDLVATGRARRTTLRRHERPKTGRLPRKVQNGQDGVYETIARLLEDRGLISSSDAQQATALDAAGVRPHLKRLVEEGRAVTEGRRRGMKYRRVDVQAS